MSHVAANQVIQCPVVNQKERIYLDGLDQKEVEKMHMEREKA